MAIKGCGASFLLGTNVVAGLTSISNPISADSLDVTVFNATCMRDFIAGLRSGTMDVSGYYESGDTNGQVAMFTAMLAGTKLTTTQKPKILWNGVNGFTGDGIITSLTVDAAVDGIVNFSATIQLTGTIAVV
jgi:predicted secreted protein